MSRFSPFHFPSPAFHLVTLKKDSYFLSETCEKELTGTGMPLLSRVRIGDQCQVRKQFSSYFTEFRNVWRFSTVYTNSFQCWWWNSFYHFKCIFNWLARVERVYIIKWACKAEVGIFRVFCQQTEAMKISLLRRNYLLKQSFDFFSWRNGFKSEYMTLWLVK